MNSLWISRRSLLLLLAILLCQNITTGQQFIPLPQRISGHNHTFLTPDSRHLITADIRIEEDSSTAYLLVAEVQTGELLVEKRLDKETLAPIGMTNDGQWLIGGGFYMHSFSEGVRRDMSKTSLYYVPLAAYLNEEAEVNVHELELTSILPFNTSPQLRVFLQSARDVGEGLVAVFYIVAHDHSSAALRTNHCVVFSTREHRIVTFSDLDSDAKRITAEPNRHFERINLVREKYKPVNHVVTTQNLIRQRVPLTYQAKLQATRAFTVPGTNVILAPDRKTFFAVGPNGAFVGDTVTRNITYLKDARQLSMPRNRWLSGIRVVFSDDSTRLAARSFHYQESTYVPDGTQASVYDVTSGSKLATLDFSISESNPHHIAPMVRFSSDNRRLLTGSSTHAPTGDPRDRQTYCGYTLWDVE